jgi:eukaryotic-like serine/threonine-protein kinase
MRGAADRAASPDLVGTARREQPVDAARREQPVDAARREQPVDSARREQPVDSDGDAALTPRTSSGEVVRVTPARTHGVTRMLPHRFGRYTLFDHIGRGGMADIYLALASTGLGGKRRVVVKEVLPDLADDERYCEMLIAEAKLAARLGHTNVVKVEDLGRDGGSLYIAMEYVEGYDLRDLLRRCARERVALPIDFSVLLVCEVLRALDYAHRFRGDDGARLGIVHRDVSPSNVLISFEGEVKLCDFGIARANDVVSALSEEETIQGKAGYMSPEHARGEVIDGRADVFAAGIILWELLSGRRLYKAQDGEALLEVARRADVPALPVRGLGDEGTLHGIVARALARDREQRYPSAGAMLRDLEQWAARAQMRASPLRFGAWLMDHFGADMVTARRSRERAMRALELGPAVMLAPLPAEAHREAPALEITPTPVTPAPLTPTPVDGAVTPSPTPSGLRSTTERAARKTKRRPGGKAPTKTRGQDQRSRDGASSPRSNAKRKALSAEAGAKSAGLVRNAPAQARRGSAWMATVLALAALAAIAWALLENAR